MISIFLFGLFILLGVFCLAKFKFMKVLLLMEKFKILVLFCSFLCCSDISRVPFIIFMVVATVEVVLSLVALTRVWDFTSLFY